MSRRNLFEYSDTDDKTDCPISVNINRSYADSYNAWREKEELQKLKDRYGDNANESSSSDTDSDDIDPNDFNPDAEKEFLSVLSALKSKDPSIYNASKKYFPEIDKEAASSSTKTKQRVEKGKPMFLKDYERKVILEKGGELVDEDGDDNDNDLPYADRQENLKRRFKVAFNDDGEDLLKPRNKTESEKVNEEEDYVAWLKGKKEEATFAADDKTSLKYLRQYWNDPKLEDGEKFLKDYLLNKRYFNQDDNVEESQEIPTYSRIVGDEQEVSDFEEDEKTLETQERFEHEYNFRFEEPNAEFLKQYPRTVNDSLRRKEEARKEKRDAYNEKKLTEKRQRIEELKRLKSLKRKEISQKLKKLKEATGEDQIPIDPDEFEKDFDPTEYDRKMKELFSDDYYGKANEDEEKPVFTPSDSDDTDEEAMDNWSLVNEKDQLGASCSNSSKVLESPKKKKFKEAVQREKPAFEPGDKTFEQYFDEYYKLDCEDVIGGDTVCRFKYRKVVANDFGLSTEEILKADPKELNAWVSLRKMSQYRAERDELYDVGAYKKKAEDASKKERILLSVYAKKNPLGGAATRTKADVEPTSKGRTLKSRDSAKSEKPTDAKPSVEKRFSEAGGRKAPHPIERVSDERLKAYGINAKKLKNKMKYNKNKLDTK